MYNLLNGHIFLNYAKPSLFELLPLSSFAKLVLNSLELEIQLYLRNFVQFGEPQLQIHLGWYRSLGRQKFIYSLSFTVKTFSAGFASKHGLNLVLQQESIFLVLLVHQFLSVTLGVCEGLGQPA